MSDEEWEYGIKVFWWDKNSPESCFRFKNKAERDKAFRKYENKDTVQHVEKISQPVGYGMYEWR